MSREDPHFRLRVPAELRDKIAEAAKANGRSLNAEIVSRLQKSFSDVEGRRYAIQSEEEVTNLFAKLLSSEEFQAAFKAKRPITTQRQRSYRQTKIRKNEHDSD